MINLFEQMLTGRHPNSLGRTNEVVELLLQDKSLLDDLYHCYFSSDEIVRLRVSSAFKRVCRERPDWIVPYFDRFVTEISKINQASTQWTFAQIMMFLDDKLTDKQRSDGIEIMKNNMEISSDWIVLNVTMEALAKYAMADENLRSWLLPKLITLSSDTRKSVSKRAGKFLKELK